MGLFTRFGRRDQTREEAAAFTPEPGLPRFAVIDVETTGLVPGADRIIEIAIVTTDPWGRILGEWSTRLNPEGPVGATHIHGITEADVAGAPVFGDVVAPLTQQLAGAAFVAHNADFDLGFVAAEFGRAGWEMPSVPRLCTMAASQYHLPGLERRRLADCCWAVGTPLLGAHSALGDARATAVLLAAYMNPHIGMPPPEAHLSLPSEALAVRWPAGPVSLAMPVTTVRHATVTPNRPSAELLGLVEQFSLTDAVDEGAPENALSYLETLASALEDGELSEEEVGVLDAVAESSELTGADMEAAKQGFVLALAHSALDDGKVSRDERNELTKICIALGLHTKFLTAALDRAELARDRRLSEGLGPLPVDWPHGEPLRVGDKVAFTGCAGHGRSDLEARAEDLGVRVVGGVSPKVALLVSDESVYGIKTARAAELGTRVVHPEVFKKLLDHLQPALPREQKPFPGPSAKRPPQPAVDSAPSELPEGVTPADVRQWGRENGWDVGVRGRLNRDLLAAFVAVASQGEVTIV